jgi:hypothetical protein
LGQPVIIIQEQDHRGGCLPVLLLVVIFFLVFALWTSLIDLTPALIHKFPAFLQGPAETVSQWQDGVVLPQGVNNTVRVLKNAWAGFWGDGQVAGNQQTANQPSEGDNGQNAQGNQQTANQLSEEIEIQNTQDQAPAFAFTTNSSAQNEDSDSDGLTDQFEDWTANNWVPYLYFSDEEAAFENGGPLPILRLYQVTPIYKTSPDVFNYPQYEFPEYQGPPGILITYVITYSDDYGEALTGIGAHSGDTETIRIFLVHPRNQPDIWDPFVLLIKRHYDDPERYESEQFEWAGTHPVVWVSENKHAMYSSYQECDDESKFGVEFEWCGDKYAIDYPITPGVDGFNVGERLNPNMTTFWGSSSAWGQDVFCGGQEVSVGECAGGLDGKWWPAPSSSSQVDLAGWLASYTYWAYISRWGAEYQICFNTGNVDYAGTDQVVDVTLEGTAHTETFFDVDKVEVGEFSYLDNGGDPFERGNQDCFDRGTYRLDENLTGLSLYMYGFAESDGEWFLESITLQDKFTGESWQFPCNCWIYNGQYDSNIDQNTIATPFTLQPY